MRRLLTAGILLAALLAPAGAQPFDTYFEVESDPLAFAAGGYSLGAGYAWGGLRIAAGAFGADVPEFVHGNSGWTMRTDGIAATFDYFPRCPGEGLFFGPEADLATVRFERGTSGHSAQRTQLGLGGRIGYRFMFGETGFFIVPWLGVAYVVRGETVTLDGKTFAQQPLRFAPALTLGWRF
jgi:hypothetical protein